MSTVGRPESAEGGAVGCWMLTCLSILPATILGRGAYSRVMWPLLWHGTVTVWRVDVEKLCDRSKTTNFDALHVGSL